MLINLIHHAICFFFYNLITANNGYDDESLTDSQTWTFNDRGRIISSYDFMIISFRNKSN
jgi:hypothetical protein